MYFSSEFSGFVNNYLQFGADELGKVPKVLEPNPEGFIIHLVLSFTPKLQSFSPAASNTSK